MRYSFGAYHRALIAAERQGPYTALAFKFRHHTRKTSPEYSNRRSANRTDFVKLVNGWLASAIRSGLSAEQIRCAMAETGMQLPQGVMSMGRLFSLDLATMPETWLRYWCHIIPRVLVAAARGGLDQVELDGRKYTDKEVEAVVHLCVTAQAETVSMWVALQQWATHELYPEYARRFDKPHACQARAREAAYHYPEW